MIFCPFDGTLLSIVSPFETVGGVHCEIDYTVEPRVRLVCACCNYTHFVPLKNAQGKPTLGAIRTVEAFEPKKVDDVLGGEAAWDTAPQTDAVCPECDSRRAYYMEIQIRSGDEPSTKFYKCVKCKAHWKED